MRVLYARLREESFTYAELRVQGARSVAGDTLEMSTEEDARKLFVAGLPETITDDTLRSLFEESGAPVSHLSMPRDRATGRPRGFAFVTFASPEQAVEARSAVDGALVEGRSISVRPFSSEPPARGERPERPHDRPRPPRDDPNRTLYVGNLPYDVEEAELRQILSERNAPEPQRIHLPADHSTGRKRGFAFINFGTDEQAQEALTALAGLNIKGRSCAVHIAHPKGERPPRQERGSFGGGFGGPDPGARFEPPPPAGPPPRRRRSGGGGGSGDEWDRPERPDRKRRGGGRKGGGRERGGGNHGRYQHWADDDDF